MEAVELKHSLVKHNRNQVIVFITLEMDLFTLIPRTLIGVAYPGFASLKAVLSDSPESSVAWMKDWAVLGVFSVVELLLDPLLNPFKHAFPAYLILKCLFLAWCMAPIELNGSDVIFNNILFPIFKQHHEQIEEQAEKTKLTVMQKLGLCIKKEKDDKGEKIEKSDLKKME